MTGARWRIIVGAMALTGALAPMAGGECRSRFALPLVQGDQAPELVLAQRVIERTWGPSDDSVYVELRIPEWRSESVALGLSAAAPGLGQLYSGERYRGLWFALAEAIGWTSHLAFRRGAEGLRDDAEAFVGAPSVPASTWSFERWAAATHQDANELARLYQADRETFYDMIASDPRYLEGWQGDAEANRAHFAELRHRSEQRLRNARYAGFGLWLNHALSAFDALRTARLHNLPLQRDLDLKLKSSWRRGGPDVIAAIERRF